MHHVPTLPRLASLASLACLVSVVAVVVALLATTLLGVPEPLLVIATILVATEVGWRAVERPVPPSSV